MPEWFYKIPGWPFWTITAIAAVITLVRSIRRDKPKPNLVPHYDGGLVVLRNVGESNAYDVLFEGHVWTRLDGPIHDFSGPYDLGEVITPGGNTRVFEADTWLAMAFHRFRSRYKTHDTAWFRKKGRWYYLNPETFRFSRHRPSLSRKDRRRLAKEAEEARKKLRR